jgi:hypothetical protein
MPFWQKKQSFFDEVPSAARKVTKQALNYRNNVEFSEPELAIGFASFVLWIARALDTAVERNHLMSVNVSARENAIGLAQVIYAYPGSVKELQNQFPGFNAVQEIQLAKAAILPNDPEWDQWKMCLTRSMILICRHLAYEVSADAGFMARIMPSDCTFLKGLVDHRPIDFIQPVAAWLKSTGLKRVGEAISNLYLSTDANTRRIGEVFDPGH